MPMHNPPHPGLTVRHDCLELLGLTVTEGAKVLGVTRQALNNLVNGVGRAFLWKWPCVYLRRLVPPRNVAEVANGP